MVYIKIFTVCPKSFASNTYLLVSGKEAIVIDPSVSIDALEKELAPHNATLIGALLTHGHFDHTVSIDTLRKRHSVPVYIHKDDACMITDGKLNGFYTLFGRECVHSPADILLNDGDEIFVGDEKIKVLHTPGHSQGSCSFIFNDEEGKTAIITGDTLFSSSFGRTDLYGGNIHMLKESIQRLAMLDRAARIYPGHNESSTLGDAVDIALKYLSFNID